MYHTSFSAELNGCAHERGKTAHLIQIYDSRMYVKYVYIDEEKKTNNKQNEKMSKTSRTYVHVYSMCIVVDETFEPLSFATLTFSTGIKMSNFDGNSVVVISNTLHTTV